MPRGGPRPGAGAPKGNLNGLKHGRNSKQLHLLLDALADMPSIQQMFLKWNRQLQRRRSKTRRLAAHVLLQLLAQAAITNNPKLDQSVQALRQLVRDPSPKSPFK